MAPSGRKDVRKITDLLTPAEFELVVAYLLSRTTKEDNTRIETWCFSSCKAAVSDIGHSAALSLCIHKKVTTLKEVN